MRFLASAFVATLLVAIPASAEPEVIEFSDLVDPFAIVFDDPYRDMGFQLLNELKLLIELDEKLSGNTFTNEERTRLTNRRKAAKDMLEINGYDIDLLLGQRWDIAKKRQKARIATNPVLDGVEVELSGYLIPAGPAADGSFFGYLVPQVGMCSHLPSPPPNKLVRVKLHDDPREKSLYVPVRISGQLKAEASDTVIYMTDGQSRMLSGWILSAKSVETQQGLGVDAVKAASENTVVSEVGH
ncbi:DUF3299 domain-containing protein [Psychromonas sp.]|nr:DUF3299 domain-containing protein [Psychromonas sp.]